jgi:hypothetical protein
MSKKYLLAIRGGNIFEFPNKKNRDDAVSDIKKKCPDIEYATSEIN